MYTKSLENDIFLLYTDVVDHTFVMSIYWNRSYIGKKAVLDFSPLDGLCPSPILVSVDTINNAASKTVQ